MVGRSADSGVGGCKVECMINTSWRKTNTDEEKSEERKERHDGWRRTTILLCTTYPMLTSYCCKSQNIKHEKALLSRLMKADESIGNNKNKRRNILKWVTFSFICFIYKQNAKMRVKIICFV